MLQVRRKEDEVAHLMSQLDNNLKNGSLNSQQLNEITGQLKVYGRDPRNADAIFSRSGISTLGEYSFGDYPVATAREACRCIANALLLAPTLRQQYVDLGLAEKAAEKLKLPEDEDGFLMSRTLFLLTYDTKIDIDHLITNHSLAASVGAHLTRHAMRLSEGDKARGPGNIESMALIETLKLLFNLSNALPSCQSSFSTAIEPMFQILRKSTLPRPPLEPPISSAINALANLDLPRPEAQASAIDIVFPPSDETGNIGNLVTILRKSLSEYEPAQLESLAIPLLTVLRKIYDIAPNQSKRQMQDLLLPSQQNRDLPIGQSDDLPSRLLRLMTSSGLVNLSECIASLMYELSDNDANQYVRNVGYGFAAGYLVSHNIPVPRSAEDIDAASGQRSTEVPINPVTGQRLDKEVQDDEPSMTTEEKEREAERLFVLFKRLKATGVMDMKDPLQQAMEQGSLEPRMEELSDSD